MNILVISNLFPPDVVGGYELGCAAVVSELRRRQHQVTVLTSMGQNSPTLPCKDISRSLVLADIYRNIPAGNALIASDLFHAKVVNLHNIQTVALELARSRYDVVYCFNLLGLGAIGLCDFFQNLQVPWVWHLMDSIPVQMFSNVRVEIASLFRCSATRTIAPSHTMIMSNNLAQEIAKGGVSIGGSWSIVPGWAVPHNAIAPVLSDSGPVRFATVGTVGEEKGTQLILEALTLLPERIRSMVHIEFFGRGDIRAFEQEAERLGVRSNVVFHGPVSHERVLSELPSFAALLFPTWTREPFGFVVLEAGVHGVAPIITRGIGSSELLEDGKSVIMIDRTPSAIAKALTFAVANPAELRRIGHSAKEIIGKRWTLEKVVDQIEQSLSSVAHPIQLRPDRVEALCLTAKYQFGIAREHVLAQPYESDARTFTGDIERSFYELKAVGRSKTRSVTMKLLRSAAMKILRPYISEFLSNQAKLREEMNRLDAKLADIENDKHP